MRIATAFGLDLAISLASLATTYATEDVPPATHPVMHPHHHHYRAYHRIPAVRDTVPAPVVVAPPPTPQAAPFGLAWPRIAPYPDNKGDEDGLSEDQNDCNKGCIDGNTPD
jgi:hypothetical protein